MSDRVALVGGGTVGRDHLPWNVSLAVDWAQAIVTNDENTPIDVGFENGRGDGYIFPFGFTIQEFLRYVLCVKKWHFEFDATIAKSVAFDPAPDDPPFYEWQYGSAHISFDYQFAVFRDDGMVGSGGIIPAREAELVLSPERRYFFFNLFEDGTNSYSARSTYSINPLIDNISTSHTAGFILSGATNAIHIDFRQDLRFDSDTPFEVTEIDGSGYGGFLDDVFWPRIQFAVLNSGQSGSRSAWRGLYDSPATLGSLTMLGQTASIVGEPLGTADDNAGGLLFTAVDVDITPEEYWPYATTVGDPVYNTGDGSVLNEPLS